MGLRCKPGDLAAITFCPHGTEHLRGRIVQITRRGPDSPQCPGVALDTRPTWRYAGRKFRASNGSKILVLNDCCLRPIRPGEGEDEMLRIAGKPVPYEAPSPWEAITEEER